MVCLRCAVLQLRDPTLRRHILVQFLITIQLLSKGRKELFGSAAIAITSVMATELEALRQRVLACVAQTPPDGVRFKDAIVHALHREVYWMKWKVSVFDCALYETGMSFTHGSLGVLILLS